MTRRDYIVRAGATYKDAVEAGADDPYELADLKLGAMIELEKRKAEEATGLEVTVHVDDRRRDSPEYATKRTCSAIVAFELSDGTWWTVEGARTVSRDWSHL